MQRLLKSPPLTVAIASLAISCLLALVLPAPTPQYHDEFSYLLAADTFAHGRLTNPAHPMWKFFETFQVLSRPTYASKYPPAQGLIMALGQLLTGRPIVGIWMSTAFACAAVAWMLQARVSRRWSLVGALLVACHPQMLDWNDSFWGGAIALAGGALLIGATLRAMRFPRATLGWFAGIGAALLANSRPFEGAVVVVLCAISLVVVRRGRSLIPMLLRAAIVFVPVLCWMGYYNWRVTGHVTQLPYSLYESQYAPTRPLAWMSPPPKPPAYRNAQFEEFYWKWEWPRYAQQRTIRGFLSTVGEKLFTLEKLYLRFPTQWLLVLAMPLAFRASRRTILWASGVWIFCLANALPVITLPPHYLAPATGALIILVVVAMRASWLARRRAVGRTLVCIVLLGQVVGLGRWVWMRAAPDNRVFRDLRAALSVDPAANEEPYLVFVRPLEGYNVHFEWVYNPADIDSAPVVFARDLGFEQNKELIDYYRSRRQRRVKLLEVGDAAASVTEYPSASQ